MKKILLILLAVLCTPITSIHAQEYKAVDGAIYTVDKTIPAYLEITDLNRGDLTKTKKRRNSLEQLLQLNEKTTAVISDTLTDITGGFHESYKEYYNGIEIEGSRYSIHYDKYGKACMANGNFRTINQLDVIPVINEENALKAALDYAETKLKVSKAQAVNNAQLVILFKDDIPYLSYKLYVEGTDIEKESKILCIFIDALDGHCIEERNAQYSISTTVNTTYSGQRAIQTQYYSGIYRLRDYTRGNGIETYDAEDNSDYTDSDNNWNSPQICTRYALDAHWGMETTYDYYNVTFNRNSYDNLGSVIKCYANDFDFNNACWDNVNKRIITGFYQSTIQPLVALDIMAHELTHGVISATAQLTAAGENGAIGEGLADVFGVCVEKYAKPNNGNNLWKIGEDAAVLRNLAAPNCKYYLGNGWVNTSNLNYDSGGVHTNCGVLGYWFYLLVNGGTGSNESGMSKYVIGIGFDQAIQICYLMITSYLNSSSTYNDVRICSIQAAQQLGYSSNIINQIRNAWFDVGVGIFDDINVSIGGNSIISNSEVYQVNGLPTNHTVTWSLSNSYYNQNCLQQNTPSTNKCTITRSSSQDMTNATLTATIKRGGVPVYTITKQGLYAHSGFKGTYYNGQTTKQVNLPYPLYVKPNVTMWIQSPNLINSSVSLSGSFIPSYWNLNTTTGKLTMSTASTTGQTTLVTATCENGSVFYLPVMTTNNNNQLNLVISEGSLEISMVPIDNEFLNSQDITANSDVISTYSEKGEQQVWLLEIYNVETGEKMICQNMTESSCSIDTKGWKRGVYVVRVVIGDEVLSEKFIIK